MATKCDIIRDMDAATTCGACNGGACRVSADCQPGQTCIGGGCAGTPAACPAGVAGRAAALCGIPNAANDRMALFALQWSPRPANATTTLEARDYEAAIRANEAALAAAYPGAAPGATSVSWPDAENCLQNTAGTPDGPFNHRWYERADVQALGMAPTYPVGGSLAAGALWPPPRASPLPVLVDYVANPDFATVLIFAILLLIYAGLMLAVRASQKARRPPRREANRPPPGGRFAAT